MMAEEVPDRPLVFVSTGTDKRFPFARLITWIEAWVERHEDSVSVLVQAGITPSRHLPSVREFDPEKMRSMLSRSDAAVLQGGPGGIMSARANGLLPIVVPRRGRLGEAADDHQVEFGRWAAARGLTVTVETESALHSALDAVLRDRSTYSIPPEPSPTLQTVTRIEERITFLLDREAPRHSRARRTTMGAGRPQHSRDAPRGPRQLWSRWPPSSD
jgi:UDP-N-acetylglucosamine transferase subunit ALG13